MPRSGIQPDCQHGRTHESVRHGDMPAHVHLHEVETKRKPILNVGEPVFTMKFFATEFPEFPG